MTIHSFVRALALSVTLISTTLLPSFTNGASRSAAVELDSTYVSLPTPIGGAVSAALAQRPDGLMVGTRFRVTSAEVNGGWAIVSVVSLDEEIDQDAHATEQEQALHDHGGTQLGGFSRLMVARKQWFGGWEAALDGTPTFAALAERAPAAVLPSGAKQILGVTPFSTSPAQTVTTMASSVAPNADNGDLVIDNSESAFTFVGDLSDAACGVGNTTRWTWASSADDDVTNDVAGVWRPSIPRTGQYKVLAHIPSCAGVSSLTTNARYEIAHGSGKANVTINQQTQRGWVELGTWNFAAGTNGYVRLSDLTSEAFSEKRAIMFDAVQWVAADQGGTTPTPTPSATPTPTPSPTPPPGPTVDYKFPWPAGQSWGFWQGWHDKAYDLGTSGTDRRVLAAADGVVTSIYSCTLSTIIDIKHADGAVFRYVHIDRYSVNPKYIKLGQPIKQGQVLGVARPNSFNDGNCGYTNQSPGWAHNNWIMPTDRPLTIDGWTTQYPTSTWTKDGVVKTPGYSSASKLLSTNQPIPSYHERVFVPLVRSAAAPPSNPYP